MKDWHKRTLKVLPICIAVVLIIIIGTNCNQRLSHKPAITEDHLKYQREVERRKNTKLMPPNQHSMKVPLGTQIGDTITCYDGLWISEWGCQRMAAILKAVEKTKSTEKIQEEPK